jgi:lipopolysaccharide transport system permease protein
VVPAGSVIISLVDLLITLGLMALLMAYYGFVPDWRLAVLPLLVVLAAGASLGAGLWLCALNVKYRDFRHIVPFIVQFGLYVSPVGFTSAVVPEKWRILYSLNPLVGIIEGFRWCLLRGHTASDVSSILLSILVTVLLLATGIWYFRKTERTFADVI